MKCTYIEVRVGGSGRVPSTGGAGIGRSGSELSTELVGYHTNLSGLGIILNLH